MLKKSIQLMKASLPAAIIMHSTASLAYDVQHEAHEHGAGEVNIAIEGKTLSTAMRFPMNDIVGFEHAPRNEQEKAQIESAEDSLKVADNMVLLDKAAECTLKDYHIALGNAEHEEHGHKEHDHDEHDHEAHHEHEEHGHDDDHHDHKEHDKHEEHHHDEHEHDKHEHEEHHHNDHHEDKAHDHDEHHEHESHSDAEVEYTWHCNHPEKLAEINLGLFKAFSSLKQVKVQLITADGAKLKNMNANDFTLDVK